MKFLVFVTFITTTAAFDPSMHKNWNSLRHDICGTSTSMRIIGGKEAPMNGYPWMVRIGQIKEGRDDFRCGGVIANARTVLTASHCVRGLPNDYKIEIIRLGEHDSETNPDCDARYCADPVVDIKSSEIIIHKQDNKPAFKNDIAIIRLEQDIKFSAFIKPICFVSGDLYTKNYTGNVVEIAGWGIYDNQIEETSKKLQYVKLRVQPNEECRKHFPSFIDIGPTQLCAGGANGKDSCSGDSGGPLMKIDNGPNGPRYYLLGIVSLGSKKCGKNGVPAIYTNIPAFMEWILDNLEKTSRNATKAM